MYSVRSLIGNITVECRIGFGTLDLCRLAACVLALLIHFTCSCLTLTNLRFHYLNGFSLSDYLNTILGTRIKSSPYNMSEDKDLLARISQLAGKSWRGFEKTKLTVIGQINIHKTHTRSDLLHQPGPVRPSTAFTFNRETGHAETGSWKPARVAPYTRIDHRGRINNPQRHRTLVLNNAGQRTPSARAVQQPATVVAAKSMVPEDAPPATESGPPPTSWVSKRDRHMQLISSTIYDKDTETRDKAIRESKRQSAFHAQHIEKAKIQRHLQTLNHGQPSDFSSVAPLAHKVYINGLSFIVKNGGSKLLRVRGTISSMIFFLLMTLPFVGISESAHSTPKEANVGGVTFYRSKNGNLYRSGIVTAKK